MPPPSQGWVPPDGGYGWIIATACMFIMVFAAQSFIDFGIFLLAFIEYYDADTTIVAAVGAIQMSVSGFCCLVWGPAIHRFGSKKTLIVGASFIWGGYLLSYLMPSVEPLLFTYGLLPGIGFASYYMAASVHVQFYFEKKRAQAVSMMMTGLSVGGFIWPPLSQWLIENFGWRGAVVIQTALHLHLIPIALLLRPPVIRKRQLGSDIIVTQQQSQLTVTSPPDHQVQVAESKNNDNTDGDRIEPKDSESIKHESNVNEYPQDGTGKEKELHTKKISFVGDADNRNGKEADAKEYNESENDTHIAPDQSSHALLESNKNNKDNTAQLSQQHQLQPVQQPAQQQQRGQCLQMIMLLKVPSFLIYCIAVYFVHQGHLGVLTFLSVRAVGIGAPKKWAAYALSVAALCNGSLRILFGYLGDRFKARRLYMYGLSALLGGILTLVSISFETYPLLVVYAAGWGIVASCYIALQNTIPIDLVGRQNLPLAVACVWFFTGIAYLTNYPLTGVLLDRDPSAKNFCYIQGVPQIIGALLMGVVSYVNNRQQKNNNTNGANYNVSSDVADIDIA